MFCVDSKNLKRYGELCVRGPPDEIIFGRGSTELVRLCQKVLRNSRVERTVSCMIPRIRVMPCACLEVAVRFM
jgi:hypothetical protein